MVTQGHEVAGTIVKLGHGVPGEVGDQVIPSAVRAYMARRNGLRGNLAECLQLELMAFADNGGWAEHLDTNAVGCPRVPDNAPLEQAAPPADAVSTGS